MGDWVRTQERIREIFSEGGVVGPRLLPILLQETLCRDFVTPDYRGHRLMVDAFYDLYLETLHRAVDQAAAWRDASLGPFLMVVLNHAAGFRGFRAANRVFLAATPFARFRY